VLDLQQFERDGFVITPSLLSSAQITHLIAVIEAHTPPQQSRGGVRDIMDHAPELRAVAESNAVREIAAQILGPEAFVVRSTLFDKNPEANWKVPWHQDVTIAIQERRDTEGYGPWSIKEGITHVQPPSAILEAMLTIRIHLDDCPATNGALRVMPGSHKLGRINQNDAPAHIIESQSLTCEAQAGEALVMRPLLLHASSPSESAIHRRVLHFDFASSSLDNDLRWHWQP
jgi:ectoine hydroxylase-related dioxygenase (phytanoyl-CoA dioxygenase family)